MYISQITLRDWKAYASASFQFPAPEPGKNIVLVGAPNGYGKTSLFEAVILGMFGKQGLSLIARSPFAENGQGRLATSYKQFLEKALHQGAVQDGRNSCSVKLVFEDDDGEPLEIQRIWHFSDAGIYRQNDDEIHVYEGTTRKAIGPDGDMESSERAEWYQNYIAENLLPYTLAHFFMFDGEQVSILAEKAMSDQVRMGIEGLLGIPVLTRLKDDLTNYAGQRRRESADVSDETVEKLERELNGLMSDFESKQKKLDDIQPRLDDMKEERERITRELVGFGAGSQAKFQNQFEQIKQYEKTLEDANAQLEKLLMEDISLALAGGDLRRALINRLAAENALEQWEGGKKQGDSNLDRYLEAVKSNLMSIAPQLTDSQCKDVLTTVSQEWEKLWYPPPDNCAEECLHDYISTSDRTKVVESLTELDDLGAHTITELLKDIAENETNLKRLRDEITRIEAVKPQVDEKRERLSELNEKIEKMDRDTGVLQRDLTGLDSQVKQKRTDLAQLMSQMDQAKPAIRRATRAMKVASMVDDIVANAVPSQMGAIAQAMTDAHHSMAHKKDIVDKIFIDKDCEVKLLNEKGMDIRRYDLSAGEKQIFTQALFSAVSSVSRRGFPMLVDTPLGRLDVEHRKGVLNHLAGRGHQVILLSTNTEVVGDYLKEIESHVQQKYLIRFERVGEVGQSTVRIGYFDDTAGEL